MCKKTYFVDVFLDPVKQLPLIQQASIQVPIRLYLLASQEAKDAYTIVESDHYHIMISSID